MAEAGYLCGKFDARWIVVHSTAARPGWFRVVAEFFDEDRAREYTACENQRASGSQPLDLEPAPRIKLAPTRDYRVFTKSEIDTRRESVFAAISELARVGTPARGRSISAMAGVPVRSVGRYITELEAAGRVTVDRSQPAHLGWDVKPVGSVDGVGKDVPVPAAQPVPSEPEPAAPAPPEVPAASAPSAPGAPSLESLSPPLREIWLALRMLNEDGIRTPSLADLARHSGQKRGSINYAVETLIKQGWMIRRGTDLIALRADLSPGRKPIAASPAPLPKTATSPAPAAAEAAPQPARRPDPPWAPTAEEPKAAARPWQRYDDQDAMMLYQNGRSVESIAEAMKRTVEDVRDRLTEKGVIGGDPKAVSKRCHCGAVFRTSNPREHTCEKHRRMLFAAEPKGDTN